MRLKRREDFRKVFAARCLTMDDVIVMYLSHNGLDVTRLGLGVGRKLGKAVVRNRIKRLIREAFRQLQMGTVTPGYDLICVPRSGQIRTLSDYETSLKNLFTRGIKKLETQSATE